MPLVAALNHLLRGQPWLRERLAAFAGRVVRVEVAPLALDLAIGPLGDLQQSAGASPDATMRLSPLTLARLAARAESARAGVELTGDASLAAAFEGVLGELRWDVEEDLSRVIGDIPARRVVGLGHSLVTWQRQAVRSLLGSASEYLTEEGRMLVGSVEVDTWAREVDALRDDAERLAKRLERLERSPGARP